MYLFASRAADAALLAGGADLDSGALDRAAFEAFADSAEFVRLFEAPLPKGSGDGDDDDEEEEQGGYEGEAFDS